MPTTSRNPRPSAKPTGTPKIPGVLSGIQQAKPQSTRPTQGAILRAGAQSSGKSDGGGKLSDKEISAAQKALEKQRLNLQKMAAQQYTQELSLYKQQVDMESALYAGQLATVQEQLNNTNAALGQYYSLLGQQNALLKKQEDDARLEQERLNLIQGNARTEAGASLLGALGGINRKRSLKKQSSRGAGVSFGTESRGSMFGAS